MSAIHIENQITPKKYNLQGEIEVTSLNDYSAKLKAVIKRGKAFAESGAYI